MENIFTSIIIHSDEIHLKGKNQPFFVNKLKENLSRVVGDDYVVQFSAKKFVLRRKDKQAIDFNLIVDLKLIPGISNIAAGIECATDFDEIQKTALKVLVSQNPKTFKVETTRAYKEFVMKSPEVSREVGGYILENAETKVDVHNPDLIVKIEIEKNRTLVLGNKEKGVGGLPVGVAGKVVCLLSGGIDSPVAAFEMMKRGAEVIFVHFHNQTINKAGVEQKIKNLVKQLEKIQGKSKLHIIPFAELQKQVISNIPAELRMIVYRRIMYKIAAQIAKNEKAKALVTGDSLSQVASQTLENLTVIYAATDMLKLAPLIGRNKVEIMDIARKIDTYDISIEPYEDCCSLMNAKHPETRAKLENVLEVEKNLDIDKLISETSEKVSK